MRTHVLISACCVFSFCHCSASLTVSAVTLFLFLFTVVFFIVLRIRFPTLYDRLFTTNPSFLNINNEPNNLIDRINYLREQITKVYRAVRDYRRAVRANDDGEHYASSAEDHEMQPLGFNNPLYNSEESQTNFEDDDEPLIGAVGGAPIDDTGASSAAGYSPFNKSVLQHSTPHAPTIGQLHPTLTQQTASPIKPTKKPNIKFSGTDFLPQDLKQMAPNLFKAVTTQIASAISVVPPRTSAPGPEGHLLDKSNRDPQPKPTPPPLHQPDFTNDDGDQSLFTSALDRHDSTIDNDSDTIVFKRTDSDQ